MLSSRAFACGVFAQRLAAACVFLSVKLEEHINIRIRDVVLVFDRLMRRHEGRSRTVLEPLSKVGRWACSRSGRVLIRQAGRKLIPHLASAGWAALGTAPSQQAAGCS